MVSHLVCNPMTGSTPLRGACKWVITQVTNNLLSSPNRTYHFYVKFQKVCPLFHRSAYHWPRFVVQLGRRLFFFGPPLLELFVGYPYSNPSTQKTKPKEHHQFLGVLILRPALLREAKGTNPRQLPDPSGNMPSLRVCGSARGR